MTTTSVDLQKLDVSCGPIRNRYHVAATSDNTRRAYRADVRHFEQWGGHLPATTESILRYLYAFAEILNPRTLARHLSSIKQWRCYQNFPDPTDSPIVSKTMSGILRLHGRPKEKAPPLLLEHMIQLTKYLRGQSTLSAVRDNALLQIGFLGALRRSELAIIRIEDIQWHPEGIEILIPRSKTDQTGDGQYCAIPNGNDQLCAVRALKNWIDLAKINSGPIFRRIHRGNCLSDLSIFPGTINRILKKHAEAAGIENASDLSSHSMRRGLATAAGRKGVPLQSIMKQGRWKQVDTVLEYIETAQRFEENAAKKLLEN